MDRSDKSVGGAVNQAVSDLGAYIRAQRGNAQISLRQLAKLAGVSNPYLSQVERGLRKPSAEILQQIARGLRISAEALYVQAGILEEDRESGPVVEAVRGDTGLNERQKQALIDIYTSFRREHEQSGDEPEDAADEQSEAGSEDAGPLNDQPG
jgi:transcriptional regulator with XRE-family HTH domain